MTITARPGRPPSGSAGTGGEGGAGPERSGRGAEREACGTRGWSRGEREPRSALPAAAWRDEAAGAGGERKEKPGERAAVGNSAAGEEN